MTTIHNRRRPAAGHRHASRAVGLLGALAALAITAGCAVPVTRTTRVYEAPDRIAEAPVHTRYGTVGRIEEVDTGAQPTGGGGALGAVVGGVIGNQIGHGAGRAAATALGIFGGAVVGNNIEQNQAAAYSGHYFRVFVHFDDGARREFDYRELAGLRAGERVRLRGGVLERA